ncbi:SDR family oxidoreductase [Sporolactobacillus sp. THM7-4]|nr:SDR family oxidoreductase [Sporolactobacillus sp. THM7-4]
MALDKKVNGKVVAVTGGSGVIGSYLCKAFSEYEAKVAVLGRTKQKIDETVRNIREDGGEAMSVQADVLNKTSLQNAKTRIEDTLGTVDILINCAGGNNPKATTDDEVYNPTEKLQSQSKSFFDLDFKSIQSVYNLNLSGTLLPSQIFGKSMVGKKGCSMINVSSMSSFTPLMKIPAYSGAKAAINNFAKWLAVYLSRSGIRVNAIAPGFLVTTQNREMLIVKEGQFTRRAEKIISQTPLKRFGQPDELVGACLFLANSELSSFITGVVLPIDGGFSAYCGV